MKSEGGARGEDPSQVKEEQHVAAEDLRKDQTFLNDAGKQSTPVEDLSSKNEQTSTTQPTTENLKTKVTQIIQTQTSTNPLEGRKSDFYAVVLWTLNKECEWESS